jgi:prepilin-type N-terminal cleavage/methylation domain-containing protein
MTRTMRRPGRGGFTVLELLVTLSLTSLLLVLAIRPLNEMIVGGQRVRSAADAVARHLFFIETLSRDARTRNRVSTASDQSIVLLDADGGDTITWTFGKDAAWREARGSKTPFPMEVQILVSWQGDPVDARYFVLSGNVEGLGELHHGMSVRLDP